MYTSKDPFFFTTPANLEVDEDATVNFGIGYTLSGLMGRVLNDAGQGIAGVKIAIESRGKKWSATTEADGSFFVSSLVAGDYDVRADEETLPAGYSADGLGEVQKVTVGATSPGKAAFTSRALRSISGRVTVYDTKELRYVAVNGVQVALREPGLMAKTDPLGRYLFRDLAAGAYTILVQNEPQTPSRAVRLGSQPMDMMNVDFQLNRPAATSVSSPAKAPAAVASPPPIVVPTPAAPPVLKPELVAATAQQHNTRGRELTAAGRYTEAMAELTEALRIEPTLALAWNARGYVLLLLHEWARAIEDENQAIRLNPKYANAYRVRAAARRSMGDPAGADADVKRAQALR